MSLAYLEDCFPIPNKSVNAFLQTFLYIICTKLIVPFDLTAFLPSKPCLYACQSSIKVYGLCKSDSKTAFCPWWATDWSLLDNQCSFHGLSKCLEIIVDRTKEARVWILQRLSSFVQGYGLQILDTICSNNQPISRANKTLDFCNYVQLMWASVLEGNMMSWFFTSS